MNLASLCYLVMPHIFTCLSTNMFNVRIFMQQKMYVWVKLDILIKQILKWSGKSGDDDKPFFFYIINLTVKRANGENNLIRSVNHSRHNTGIIFESESLVYLSGMRGVACRRRLRFSPQSSLYSVLRCNVMLGLFLRHLGGCIRNTDSPFSWLNSWQRCGFCTWIAIKRKLV